MSALKANSSKIISTEILLDEIRMFIHILMTRLKDLQK